MQTIPSKLCFAIAMLVATATPVFGDVSVAQVIQFKLTAAGPMGRSTGSGPVNSITSAHGSLSRFDIKDTFELHRIGENSFTVVHPRGRTYEVFPYSAYHTSDLIASITATIKRTPARKTIMGRECQEYDVRARPSAQAAFGGTLWVAEDLPRMPRPLPESVFGFPLVKNWKVVRGLVLGASLTLDARKDGTTLLTVTTTSLSTNPLPATTFQIPTGYSRSDSSDR